MSSLQNPRSAYLRAARRFLAPLVALAAVLPLSGCDWVLFHAAGDVAAQEGRLVVVASALMATIIIPVMALTIWFAWRYRATAKPADYAPDWDHSIPLELLIWAAPLLIIIVLGAVTWITTHTLDPFRPLGRIDGERPVDAKVKPLVVEVVALDWKWLFIYPEQGVAVLNEVAAPLDVPVEFHITSESVMNSFFVPAIAGQIYAMPGMESSLRAVVNRAGTYQGISANYSGAGFSGMHFDFRGLDAAGFEAWVRAAREAGGTLDRAAYRELARPGERGPVRRFGAVEPGLFAAVANRCVAPGARCIGDMMARRNEPAPAHESPQHGE